MDDHLVLRPHNNPYPDSFPIPSSRQDLMSHLDRLKFFLATAPSRWSANDVPPDAVQHPALNRFLLPSGEYVTCVLWSGLYHITGTDIVRALVFRFEAFGRPVRNMKKFEEGVFSDLRNLKPGHDACLEEPKSPFLDLLFKYQCIRTQKKQKVFYWFSVPHDRLFLDALERDLKREKMGQEPTTTVTAEPAISFSYDPKRSLFEQFAPAKYPHSTDPSLALDSDPSFFRIVHDSSSSAASASPPTNSSTPSPSLPDLDYSPSGPGPTPSPPTPPLPPNPLARTQFFNMFAMFEGSPTYKQRRKKVAKPPRRAPPPAIDVPQYEEYASAASAAAVAAAVYEDAPVQYPRPVSAEQPQTYGAAPVSVPLPSPGYASSGYTTYDSPTEPESASAQGYYVGQEQAQVQQHPVSAPSSRIEFDVYHASAAAAAGVGGSFGVGLGVGMGVGARRPRSVTPSLPVRVAQHVRRPSTASEAPVRHHQHQHHVRGYHPYAATAPMHVQVQQQQQEEASPFAYMPAYTHAHAHAHTHQAGGYPAQGTGQGVTQAYEYAALDPPPASSAQGEQYTYPAYE